MSDIQITIDSTATDAMLRHIADKLDHLQPAMNSVAHDIAENIRFTFRDLKTPYGVPWKTLSPVTVSRRRIGSSVPLNDTGVLRNSITFNATDSSAEIGTNVPYAAMMNFGGSKSAYPHLWGDIPARQFMPINPLPAAWEEQMINTVSRYLGVV